jgi:hypothetical protein
MLYPQRDKPEQVRSGDEVSPGVGLPVRAWGSG